MTAPFDMETPSRELDHSEAQLEPQVRYTFRLVPWQGEPPPDGPPLCNFIQDRRDCDNPAEPGHRWCRFHLEADAFYRTDWPALTYEQRTMITRGFSVKWYPYCYRCELNENGVHGVIELIDKWNAHYETMK